MHFGLITAMFDFRARFYFGKINLAFALLIFQNEHIHKKHEFYYNHQMHVFTLLYNTHTLRKVYSFRIYVVFGFRAEYMEPAIL